MAGIQKTLWVLGWVWSQQQQARGPDNVSTKMEKFMGLWCELAASDPALKCGPLCEYSVKLLL